jgi:hypothetical protein
MFMFLMGINWVFKGYWIFYMNFKVNIREVVAEDLHNMHPV